MLYLSLQSPDSLQTLLPFISPKQRKHAATALRYYILSTRADVPQYVVNRQRINALGIQNRTQPFHRRLCALPQVILRKDNLQGVKNARIRRRRSQRSAVDLLRGAPE